MPNLQENVMRLLSKSPGGGLLRSCAVLALALSFSPLARAGEDRAEIWVNKFNIANGGGLGVSLQIRNPPDANVTVTIGLPMNPRPAHVIAKAMRLAIPVAAPAYTATQFGSRRNAILLKRFKATADLRLLVDSGPAGAFEFIHAPPPALLPTGLSFLAPVNRTVNGTVWSSYVYRFN
jgi:hypothetical protein